MVWILVPNHPSLGTSKYYLTSGAYKIGRKDTSVVIQTDKTVSRLHAEIIIDPLKSINDSTDRTSFKPRIILKDLSKFGSFVNRTAGSKPVFSLPNKEKELNEGDIITFGTDNSSFRLEYFALCPFIGPLADESRRNAVSDLVISAGGYVLENWCSNCTHLLVEDGSYVTNLVLQAVAERIPVIGVGWIEVLAARGTLSSEFPSCSRFTPNMQWKIDGDAKCLKIIEPEAREPAFKGFIFYVGLNYLYSNKHLLQSLVEASGGSVHAITEISRSRASSASVQTLNEIIIVPDLEPQLHRWMSAEEVKSVSHVRKTSEDKFIAAVLTGEFKENYFEEPASPSPASSDETVEALDSGGNEDEISSAALSDRQLLMGQRSSNMLDRPKSNECFERGTFQSKTSHVQQSGVHDVSLHPGTKTKQDSGLFFNNPSTSLEEYKVVQKDVMPNLTSYTNNFDAMNAMNDDEGSRVVLENLGDITAAIEFRKDLIVQSSLEHSKDEHVSDDSVINFKRFRKKPDSSGNTFSALVPFAAEPYRTLLAE
ncbi:hypothetical protein KP509_30G050900 [Ceratopteris richardii]|uniref:Uncharacterized protein n=1 Tax=Ceratopteris richardii TaxID=49495 RepID=A0A8T2R3D8_CERRI|nr:hypothetical protein KP509_30G050900 [Ceratopteris richardii]KAH7290497.1 hypothetical protein KP509_30G050900 [Ceratopteris richardii]KAH7290500.1 hypothetical protein KP509_30G050900 [Ceratopteris richardii]